MKVRLISLTPTGYPNLALMKLSAFHKAKGDIVTLDEPDPDLVYVSSPFSQYKSTDYSKMFPDAKIEYGGYGFNGRQLPENIEHYMPDYPIFNCDRSMGFTCYDDQTEVLTKQGWKYFIDLYMDDEVATLDTHTNELVYQRPSEIVKEPYNGSMLCFKNRYVNLVVTPNHSMYVRRHYLRQPSTFEFIRADVIKSYYQYQFKKDCVWNGLEKEFLILPSSEKRTSNKEFVHKMDDWLEFLGYYLSEGSTQYKKSSKSSRRSYLVKISQYHNANPIISIKIEDCIRRLGYSYYRHPKDGFLISNKQLYEHLKPLGKAHDKHVTDDIKQLCSRQLKIFFDAYVLGDGHVYTSKKGKKCSCIISSSKRMVDDIQEILLKIGVCGDIKIHVKKGMSRLFRRENRFITATDNIYRIISNSHYTSPIFSRQSSLVEQINYNGMVYCCEVPNHVIYVRRNGIACWCGNTRGCFRNCWFCIVPRMEGKIRINSPIEEFHSPEHDTVELLDNNILYFEDWFMRNTDYLIKHDLKLVENGIDIRLVNEKNAERLHELNIKSDRLHFAFDDLSYEKEVRRGIEILEKAGFKPRYLMCYILAWPGGFDDAWKRLEIIWKEYRIDPFVQIYNNSRKDRQIRRLARWCNRHKLRKSCEFNDYKR